MLFAKELAQSFGLEHKVCILGHRRTSREIYADLFYIIGSFGFQCAICADTADELLGGYILHRDAPEEEHRAVFEDFWSELVPKHLESMGHYAKEHNVAVVLPYLAAHNFMRHIALSQRIDNEQGKIILRQLAQKLGVPESIINRRKYGLCSVWERF